MCMEEALEGTKELGSFSRKLDFLKVFEERRDLTGLAFCTDYDGVRSGNELKTTVQINMMVA